MAVRSKVGGADCGVERFLGQGRCALHVSAADVRGPAERVADEVAAAVDLLYEAFALEKREGVPECGCADLVVSGQVGFRGEAFAGLQAALRDLGPEIVGDGVAAGRCGLGHQCLRIRRAMRRVRACIVSSSPDSKQRRLALAGSWMRSTTRHGWPPTWITSPRCTVVEVISTFVARAPLGVHRLTGSPAEGRSSRPMCGRCRRRPRR